MEKYPTATKAIGMGISAMTTEDPYELWKKQQDYLRENRSGNIAGINYDGSGSAIGSQQEDVGEQQWSATYNRTNPMTLGDV